MKVIDLPDDKRDLFCLCLEDWSHDAKPPRWLPKTGYPLVDVGFRAQRGYEATAELAPVGEHQRQNLTDLGSPEVQKAMPAPTVECFTNSRSEQRLDGRGVVLWNNQDATVRRERRGEANIGRVGTHVSVPSLLYMVIAYADVGFPVGVSFSWLRQ